MTLLAGHLYQRQCVLIADLFVKAAFCQEQSHCFELLLKSKLPSLTETGCCISVSSRGNVVWLEKDWPLQDKASGFQDNDSLARELAKELNADLLVLLTNVDGLMDGPPKDRNSK